MAGHGRVAFVSGEAGAGKTTLFRGFSAHLAQHHPDVVLAAGRCSTAGPDGDPYLPWREVMSSLLGVAGAPPYDELGPAQRRLNHADIAVALEHLAEDRSNELSAVLAWHHEQAGHPREAATWLTEAGERAASAGAAQQAAEMFRRALTLLPPGAAEGRWRAGLGLSSVLRMLQADADVVATLRELIELAESIGDPGKIGEAYWRLCWFRLMIDDGEAHDAAAQALRAAREADRPDIEARVLADTSTIERRQARPDAAREAARQAWALAEGLDDDTILYVAWRLGWYYADEGDLGRSMELSELAVQKARVSDRRMMSRVLVNLADSCIQLGLFDRARAVSEEALAVIQLTGESNAVPAALGNIGIIQLADAELASAEANFRRALDLATGGGAYLPGSLEIHLGTTLEASGRITDAAAAFRRAEKLFADAGQDQDGVESWAGLARCASAESDLDTALQYADRVWAVLSGPELLAASFFTPVALSFLACADVFVAAGLQDRARLALDVGLRWLDERAASISDPAWRASFLDAVPAHRRLRAWHRREFSPD